jgi:hypothetical protein
MPRKEVTSRFRNRSDLFTKRIVITVSPVGALIVVVGMVVASTRFPYYWLSSIAVISTIVAIATVVEARHQLRTFRYEITAKIVARLEDWDVPENLPDLREALEFAGEVEDPNAKVRRIRPVRSA